MVDLALASEWPRVSVVIPCRNEERHIADCLESVLGMDYPSDLIEVFIVDGLSTDRTRAIVEGFSVRDSRVKVLENAKTFVNYAMNLGIEHASGDYLVRLDAHSTYPKNYLRDCIRTATRTNADNVGGCIVPGLSEDTLQARLIRAITSHRFGIGNSRFRLASYNGPADTVPFGCYRMDVFERHGGFDQQLLVCEDFEINRRIAAAGGLIWLNSSIEITYFNQTRLWSFFRKTLSRDGFWNPIMWKIAPHTFRVRHTVPLLFTLVLCASLIVFVLPEGWRWPLIALMSVYGATSLIASIQLAIDEKRRSFVFLLPPLFLAYHILYGLGGILGLLRAFTAGAPSKVHA